MSKKKREAVITTADKDRPSRTSEPVARHRPALDEVSRAIDLALDAREARQPGSVVNKQRDTQSSLNPDGTVPHFSYYTLDPVEMKAGRVHKERDRLTESGYWLADGDEYVPETSTAEIWMTYADVERAAHARRVQRVIENRNEARQNRLVH